MRWCLGLVGLLAGAPGPAPAQSPALERLARRIAPGTQVRVRLRLGTVVTGEYRAAPGGELLLDADQRPGIPFADVDSLWVEGRAIGRGAARGAKVGAIAGGVLIGGLSALVFQALCETDDCNALGAGAVGGVIGGASGAATGAMYGAAIGSGIHVWKLAYPGNPDRAPVPPAGRDRFGLARGAVVYGRNMEAAGSRGSIGGRAAVFTRFTRYLAAGPEMGYVQLGRRVFPYHYRLQGGERPSPTTTIPYRDIGNQSVLETGFALRVMPGSGRIRPYLVGSVGVHSERVAYTGIEPCLDCPPYSIGGDIGGAYPFTFSPWVNETPYPGYSVGAGIEVTLERSPLALGVEARWHARPGHVTVALVLGTGW